MVDVRFIFLNYEQTSAIKTLQLKKLNFILNIKEATGYLHLGSYLDNFTKYDKTFNGKVVEHH